MAKIESRLPFFRSNKTKACPASVYIIADTDRKLSDYQPDSTDKILIKPKTISNNIGTKNSKLVASTTLRKPQTPKNGTSRIQGNAVVACSCATMTTTTVSISSTSTTTSNSTSPISSTNSRLAVAHAASKLKPFNDSQNNSQKLVDAHQKVAPKSPPSIPPKPALPVSKLKPTKISTNQKTAKSPTKRETATKTSGIVSPSALARPENKVGKLERFGKPPSPSKIVAPKKTSPVQRQLFSTNTSISKPLHNSIDPHKVDNSIKQESTTPKCNKDDVSSDDLTSKKFGSKLQAPVKSGLRRPVINRLALKVSGLQQVSMDTAFTSLEETEEINVVSQQCETSCDDNEIEMQECSSQPLMEHQVRMLSDVVCLNTTRSVLPVYQFAATETTVDVPQTHCCDINYTQTFCTSAHSVESVEDDEVFDVKSSITDPKISLCYSYLQQAEPCSYRKQLVNAFMVKEELSPTAESHARHIANSLPQPWLSADIANGDVRESSPPLLIPEPLPCETEGGSKLHVIAECVEPVVDGVGALASPPSCRNKSMVGESIDELVAEHKRSLSEPSTKTPTVLGSLFSKIGGRRILARPQESPPRARRSLAGKRNPALNSPKNRRKLSPKTRRREMQFNRPSAVLGQQSPKHKPLIQDESPIRSKEAYYGGAHCHMPKPVYKTEAKASAPSNGFICSADSQHGKLSSQPDNKPRSLSDSSQATMQSADGGFTSVSGEVKDGRSTFPLRRSTIRTVSCSSRMASTPVMSRSLSHKKKQKMSTDNGTRMKTNYSATLRMGLPPCPEMPHNVLEQGSSALSKVTVAVRLKAATDAAGSTFGSYISADSSRGQLILRDPTNESNMAPSCRRQLAAVPKFFAFDKVFGSDAVQINVCRETVVEILQSVLQGSDGCLASFGQPKTGKSRSLIGDDSSCADFGIIPAAISWLYQLIEDQKTKTGARFSIRISALEVRGKDEKLTDLLADCTSGADTESVQLTTTDVYGAQVENLSEMRAPDVEHAGHYLDAALTTSYNLNEKSESKGSHFLFTLHIYQHHVETKPSPGGSLVAGGRSRLHFIDIGPCAKSSSEGSALTLAALGSTIAALLNGHRQFPQKESKLATLLKESVGHPNCRTCLLVHISTQPSQYTETLQILQLTARIHRMKVKRRNKISSNSSDDTGSTSSNMRRRRGIRMGTSASLSDPDVSSSEQSIDTVIYVPGSKNRHRHATSAHKTSSPTVNGSSSASPYSISGSVKKRLSDDETSSEGRRRMPRTNARVWPKSNITENEIWLDTPPPPPISREHWHIPGNANPMPVNAYAPHNGVATVQQYALPHPNTFTQPQYSAPSQGSWLPLSQYNGQPEQIAHLTSANQPGPRQAWTDSTDKNGHMAFTEVSKQELWVDGPTAFRKNIEGLTQNLQKEKHSPTKRNQRHNGGSGHNEERADKSKHHRAGSKKHREGSKHCHQCGADIKKDGTKVHSTHSKTDDKGKTESKHSEEPGLSIKPFVKDWVMRHSKNNTPTKADQPEQVTADARTKLVEDEASIQEDLQLTINVDGGFLHLPNLPCSDNLMNDTSDQERQDAVHIDDSVSNVTADDRVGFESKEGSSFDENSLSEEVVEVCDAACQTEFTDSDSVSNGGDTARMLTSGVENAQKRESIEAFLDATLQGTLLRKPDGASDPSLHKELVSPLAERKPVESPVATSNTLPRNTHLKTPQQPIRLQPYLSSPKQVSREPEACAPVVEVAPSTGPATKPESKLRKLFRQHSSDSQETAGSAKSASHKKSKGSKLPSLRFSSKVKDKPATSVPTTPTKKSEQTKKEKKSFLQGPSKVIESQAGKTGARISYNNTTGSTFQVTSSPYRQYVLPKPSYTHSEACSDSSCPSHTLPHYQCSVSSGYDSMTHVSSEDAPPPARDDNSNTGTESAQANSKMSACFQGYQQTQVGQMMRQARVEQLLYRQTLLKREMAEAKSRLMVPISSWNYDSSAPSLDIPSLHVASQADRRNDDGYLEALEKETETLQKRVDACKSRIMLITSIF